MLNKGLNLTLVLGDAEPSVETPWGLAKAYVDEINAWLTENDGWNADGSANRKFNRVPFSDYEITDSEGNSWTPYVPRNTPWKVCDPQICNGIILERGEGGWLFEFCWLCLFDFIISPICFESSLLFFFRESE